MRSDLPHPRATPNDWRAVGGATGKMKKEVHPLYFFIFDSVKKRRKNKVTCKIKILQPKAERFCALFEAVASSQKTIPTGEIHPLGCKETSANIRKML